MKKEVLVKKSLPQNPAIEVLVPNYKEPVLPVDHEGFGWYGLMAYNEQGQLMCHECGEFWDGLSFHIWHRHRLHPLEYKDKYGLLHSSKLISATASAKYRVAIINDSTRLEEIEERFRSPSFREKRVMACRGRKGTSGNNLERQNRHDSCPLQCIRWVQDAAKYYGHDNVTTTECEQFRGGLNNLLKSRYGSFNKAKQLAKLAIVPRGGAPLHTKELILEDMVCFYREYSCWPTCKDYRENKTICSETTMLKNGSITRLRQEAMKLKDEQDARPNDNDTARIAESIEREYAGTARR